MPETAKPEVVAAGAVVARRGTDGIEVVLIHRERYDDWSFPKGKADPGETPEQTARREIHEETGFRCELKVPLPQVTYRDRKGRAKEVHYWLATVESGAFVPNEEVDRIEWVAPEVASARLTYARDAVVLDAAVSAVSMIEL